MEVTAMLPTKWKKGKLLGEGGFGKIYLCCDSNSNLLFALKDIALQYQNKSAKQDLQSVINEVHILRSIQHKRVVQYYGCQQDKDRLFIFLEYMPGGSLREQINMFGPMSEEVTRNVTEQILEGLVFLHSKNIAHRDIKAANTLRDTSGNIKLADFGLSKQLQKISCDAGLKTTVGTAHWMAPEVIQQKGYGYNADLWSVGCTVVELLTSKPPYGHLAPAEASYQIGTSNQHPVYKLPSASSQNLKNFLLVVFQHKSANRTSAKDLLQHEFITSGSLQNGNHALALKNKDEEMMKIKNQLDTLSKGSSAKDQNIMLLNGNHALALQNKDEEIKRIKNQLDTACKEISAKDQEIKLLNEKLMSYKVTDINLLMIGSTGVGKSALGNTILNRNVFKSQGGTESITEKIQCEFSEIKGRVIKVVDGPGLDNTRMNREAAANLFIEAMTTAISANPRGYHAFLLVVRFDSRFTPEDRDNIDFLKKVFGENFVKEFCILVLTFGDTFESYEYEEMDKTFEERCRERARGVEFRNLLQECNNRALLFDNITKDHLKKDSQLDALIHMVNHLTNQEHCYTDDNFEKARIVRERLMVGRN